MILDAVVFDPNQIWLEFSESEQNQAWHQSQSFSNSSSCWNAYLNQLCLAAALPWLREEYAIELNPWPLGAALPSFWEVANGTAIASPSTRFVLIPSESIDNSELRVPQEWVDIPNWVADYYLAVQVNLDDRYILIWGYATHQCLKNKGTYDIGDRTYLLTSNELISDLNVLLVAHQLCPSETTRAEVTPLPNLSSVQAENLLQRLANPAVIQPRLAIPFELWGGLLQHGGRRQQLYEQRLGLPEQRSIIEWLRVGVSNIAQQMGWERIELQPSLAGSRGEESTVVRILSRRLHIAGQTYELRVFPLGNIEEYVWRFELQNSAVGGLVPGGFKLRLLTEDLQGFDGNEDVANTAQEMLFIDVAVAAGEGLVCEIEPFPENYDREILRF